MKKILLFTLVTMLISSCQPSKITQSWAQEAVTPKKYQKILVLGILPAEDNELQVKMENHLSDDLRAMGYLALAANKIYAPGTFVKGDTAAAKKALENKGFDGILTIVLLDKKKTPYYVPGKITGNEPYDKLRGFDKYYNAVAENIITPGYYGEETKYSWENNFYDLRGRQLIYSARTRSFDLTSKNTLAHTYGILMVENLIRKNILAKPVDTGE